MPQNPHSQTKDRTSAGESENNRFRSFENTSKLLGTESPCPKPFIWSTTRRQKQIKSLRVPRILVTWMTNAVRCKKLFPYLSVGKYRTTSLTSSLAPQIKIILGLITCSIMSHVQDNTIMPTLRGTHYHWAASEFTTTDAHDCVEGNDSDRALAWPRSMRTSS